MSFNRFGAVAADLLPLYTDTQASDFGGDTAIQGAIDRAVDLILGAVSTQVYQALTEPRLVRVVARATESQSTTTAPRILPCVADSAHVWVGYASEFQDRPRMLYDNQATGGLLEIDADTFSLNATTGVVTLTNALAKNQIVYLSYIADVDSASYAIPSLARLAVMGAAAELGGKIYARATDEWALVDEYRARFTDELDRLRSGSSIPDEIRLEAYWQEVERTSNAVASVPLLRG
jgi:hypothetical protein